MRVTVMKTLMRRIRAGQRDLNLMRTPLQRRSKEEPERKNQKLQRLALMKKLLRKR